MYQKAFKDYLKIQDTYTLFLFSFIGNVLFFYGRFIFLYFYSLSIRKSSAKIERETSKENVSK